MNAMFLKLLNMSAAGSVLILAVVVLRAVLKKAPRWIICVMWALVAIRLICPVSLSSPVSAFRATPSIVSESGEVEVFRPAGGSEKPLLAVDTVQIEQPRASSETIREIPGTSYAVTQRSRDAYLPPLVTAYLLGLSAMLLYALVSTLLLRKRVAVSLRQRGNIRICDEVAGPFILGILRPVIYLPSSLSEEERRFVLAHERAHLRRLDHIWKPLGFLILSVHWFNPLCWLGYLLFCRDIELACDEKVIRQLGRAERAAYSQTLLNCSAHRILAACPVAFGETDVKARVKAVLNYKKPAFWLVLAAVLGCVAAAVFFATSPTKTSMLTDDGAGLFLLEADSTECYNNFSNSFLPWIFGDCAVDIDDNDAVICFHLYGEGATSTLLNRSELHKQMPLVQRKSGYLSNFFFSEGMLYVSWQYFDREETALFSKDLVSKETRYLCTTAKTYQWAVINEQYFYMESRGLADADRAPLWVRDLQTGQEKVVCPWVSEIGIVGGKLRYVSYDEGSYRVFEYSAERGESSLLGEIPAILGQNCEFQFTSDSVVMGRYGSNVWNWQYNSSYARQLVVFSPDSGLSKTIVLPSEVERLVVCDYFAYAVLYNMRSNAPDQATGIFRIDLASGEAERIPHALEAATGIWADNDDIVYIGHYDLHGSGKAGAHGVIYRYDAVSGQDTLIVWLGANGKPLETPATQITAIPSPSTEPNRLPEQSALPTPKLPPEGSGLSENAPAFVPADPEAFLLSFSSGKVIERIDYSEREYADSGKGFDEIISARTWTAHESRGFPASAPDRVVELLRDDFPQDPGWVLRFEESDGEMLCIAWQAHSSSDATWVLDCGENLMDELMAWATYEAGKPIDEAKPRMTLNDVYALADKGISLTWADLLAFEGEEIGSGQLIWRFPINDTYCLEAYDGELDGPPERVLLIKADENGEFRAGPGLYIDIFTQGIDTFLSGAHTQSITVTSGGETIEPSLYLQNEKIWTDSGWLVADGIPLASALEDAEQIPTLTLASDFIIRFDGYSRKSGLQIYDERFQPLREDWYGDTAVNWLAPGRYYGVIETFGPAGRYIASEGASEESVYRAVFRLNVDSEGAEPYAPEKAVGLTRASLHTIGEEWVLTDAARLAKLEAWLKNAEPLPGGAGCPFGSVLTLTCADGSQISCCPAEDSCGVVFANGVYYRFAADNKDFWMLFGLMID